MGKRQIPVVRLANLAGNEFPQKLSEFPQPPDCGSPCSAQCLINGVIGTWPFTVTFVQASIFGNFRLRRQCARL
jgi:hypothetical protein